MAAMEPLSMELGKDRRRFRMSLRRLMLGVGLVCVVLGGISTVVHWQLRNMREHMAKVEVSRLGGTYGMETALHFAATGEVTGWFHRRFLNRVAMIDLSTDAWPAAEARQAGGPFPPVGDDSLPVLWDLWSLRVLDLSGSAVTDRGVAHLKRLTGLEELDIQDTKISDAGYRELREALPECQILR